MALYGLTCGYWTDDPDDLDNHVLSHGEDARDIYDLFEYQAPADVELHKCRYVSAS
jgi:hypothetical protein